MSSNGIIEHRKDYFYIEFREEYLIICMNCKYKKPVKEGTKSKASPHCKTLILAILERWTDTKRKKGEPLAIYMTYPQWVDEMHGLFGRNVIIDSLDELIGEGLVFREAHRMYGKDTYKYSLNSQELNRRIKLLPPGNAFTSKRDETSEAFTNKPDTFTNKPDTRLQVNEDAFTSGRNIESNTDSNNIDSERKNDEPQQSAITLAGEDSFSHSLDSSSQSSQDTKSEVVLNERQQRIFDFAKKDIFKAKIPEITEKIKSVCDELVDHIETQEQFDSLVAVVRKRFPKGAIHLKNLTNANVLNEWSQTQAQCTPDANETPMSDNDFAVTDDELAEDIKKTVHFYGTDDRFEECLANILDFKRKAGLSNYKVCDMIANASIGVQREHGIDVFMEKLQGSLYW